MSAIEKQETSAEVTRVAGSDSQGNGSLSDEGKVEAQLDSPEPQSEAPKPPERKIHGVSVSTYFTLHRTRQLDSTNLCTVG